MKLEVKICLDEIEAAYNTMVSSKVNKDIITKCKGWARKHRNMLKDMGYKGRIPRQPKIMKKYQDEGDLFDE